MKLIGYLTALNSMIFVFSILLDVLVLKGRYATIFVEENLVILYLELALSFYAIIFIAKKTYEESLFFWKKRFKLNNKN
jgi:hypothetical protein